MDCSMREVSRREHCSAPRNASFGAIVTHSGENSLHKSFFWYFRNGLIFCLPKNGFLDAF